MRKTIAVLTAFGLGLIGAPALAACADNPRIDWKVAGGFTLFNKTEAGRQAGDALLDDLAAANPSSAGVSMEQAYETTIRHLVETDLPDGRRLYQATFYDRATESYGEKQAFLKPTHRRIWVRAPGEAGDCVWRAGDQASIPRACAEATALEVAAEKDVTVTAEIAGAPAVTTCVKVEDTLVLALGDSFAAGEGNPDRPTDWSKLSSTGRAAKRDGIDWWSSKPLPPGASADWWDNTCHRSLLSQHAQAALSLAAKNRRRSVTFVSFACSGATMLDGFVAPRTSAPGGKRWPSGEWKSVAYRKSQINQAVELLCQDQAPQYQRFRLEQGLTYWNTLSSHTVREPGQKRDEVSIRTCSTWSRRPDVVLNTLGGNDIGFAGVAGWAVMPAGGRGPMSPFFLINAALEPNRNPDMGLVCPLKVPGQWRCETTMGKLLPGPRLYSPSAEDLALVDLPKMLDLGARAFQASGLGAEAKVKIHTLYPSILRDDAGRLCGEAWTQPPGARVVPAKDEGLRMQREPWLAQFTRVPLLKPDRWSFGIANAPDGKDCLVGVPDNIAYYSSCVLEKRAWTHLNRNVGQVMARSGWTVVDQANVTTRHGVCARDGREGLGYEREFGWPRWTASGWDPKYGAPTDWRPYAPRAGRWFRTANDSALTQYVVFKGGEGRGEAVSGTIHPTAQAHAVMADRIVQAAAAAD